jgi:glycosyltransferase involved in cell wall biosynthesis
MRVLHVVPSLAARDGGPSRVVLGLCRALGARGIDTVIATTVAEKDDVPFTADGTMTALDGLPVVGFGRRGEAFKYSAGLARWLADVAGDFDVIHVHAVYSHSSLAAGKAARACGTPYVLRPLGSLDPWAQARRRWQKRLIRPAVAALITGASAIHFTTDEEARLAAPMTPDARSAVIPPGIDDELLAEPVREAHVREKLVVAIGRLHAVKRLDLLLEAFHAATAVGDLNDWHLVIAGDGDAATRADLERAAADGPAAHRVRFAGWLAEDAKRSLLARASLIAMPSFQENFGLALVEAMACGVVPIVSSGVNLSRDIEAAHAGWVAGSNAAEFAVVLASAMRDAADLRIRSEAARRFASRFTWSAAAAGLEDLYRSLRPVAAEGRA